MTISKLDSVNWQSGEKQFAKSIQCNCYVLQLDYYVQTRRDFVMSNGLLELAL